MVGADTKRDALLSNAAARAAVVDFVVSSIMNLMRPFSAGVSRASYVLRHGL
jgi:hypothetical protein